MRQEMDLRAWARIRGPQGPERWDEYVRMLCMYAGAPWKEPVDTSVFRFGWERARDAELKARAEQNKPRGRPGPINPVPVPPQPEFRRAAARA